MTIYVLSLLLVMTALTVLTGRRTGFFSTLSIFSIFNVLCLLYFFGTQNLGMLPEVQYSALPLYGLVDYSFETANVYLILTLAAWVTALTVPRAARSEIEMMTKSVLSVGRSKFSFLFMLLCLFLTVVHALDFDFSYLISYQGYHSIRDLGAVGLSNPISVFYQKVGPLFAACCGSLAMVAWWSKRRIQAVILMLLAAYGFIFAFATASRESALVLGVMVATYYLVKRRFDLWFIAGLGLTMFTIAYAIAARSRYGDIGLLYVSEHVARIYSTNILQFVISVLSNVAQGATIFAHAVRLQPQYPFDFIVLSLFSPFPGDVDGYAAVAAVAQVKATQVNPLSAIAEVYYFGPVYFAVLLTMVMVILRSSTRIIRAGSPVALPAYGVVILLIFRLHQYPMRISNRMMLFYAALWGAHIVIKWLLKRRRARGQGLPVGASSRTGA